jgi:2,5-diketo-D-gluconate reductase A
MTAIPSSTVSLPSGAGMPLVGFGTWQLKGPEAREASTWALQAGYRHLDTATMYGNEREVGAALAGSGISRDEVFVTTKLPPSRAGQERDTLQQSLTELGVPSVDLWLVHAKPSGGGSSVAVWKQFVQAQADGLATDIGVSNYSLSDLDELREATGVLPAVNQIEWSPLLFDQAELDGHRDRGVVLEGYSALRGGALDNATIGDIAERLGRTPAQVIVRWHLQHGIVVIPKSRDQQRIATNADVDGFELTAADMTALDSLGR